MDNSGPSASSYRRTFAGGCTPPSGWAGEGGVGEDTVFPLPPSPGSLAPWGWGKCRLEMYPPFGLGVSPREKEVGCLPCMWLPTSDSLGPLGMGK